ncbi:MAG TPA: 30S ribosomal protein S16 [bacterium]|nr:30S ribosomal protein S16 [bacterium]HOC88434.1 30S ribosomal protein S16 [bacterium]
MSVKLRLSRIGKKKQPFYRIVAIDSKSSRDSSYLDKIGHYNPVTKPAELVIDRAKALKWLGDGAIPSDTVNSLFRSKGILHEWDLRKRGASEEKIAEEMTLWQDQQLQRSKREEAKNAMAKRETEAKKPAKPEAKAPAAEKPAPVAAAAVPEPEPAPAAEEPAPVAAAEEPAPESAPAAEEPAPAAEEPAPVAAAEERAPEPAPADEAPAAEESTEPKSEA